MALFTSTQTLMSSQLAKLKELADVNNVLREAAIDGAAAVLNRIQNKGKKSDESQIGQYSTKKLGFAPITSKFGSIANKSQKKARKGSTSNFGGGYKEFRKSLGRQVNYIDLTLTGEMFDTWKPFPIDKDSWGVGFDSTEQNKIAGYHENRFGDLFILSNDELKTAYEIINRKVNEILNR